MINIDNIVSITKQYSEIDSEKFLYKVILETTEVVYVPHSLGNKDYITIQQWIADGGTVIDNPPE